MFSLMFTIKKASMREFLFFLIEADINTYFIYNTKILVLVTFILIKQFIPSNVLSSLMPFYIIVNNLL